MVTQRLLRGDPARSATLYIAIGVLSLIKAIIVRDDSKRFRRELLDAGLFIGVGLALRQYSKVKAQKRAEIQDRVPKWLVDDGEASSMAARAKQQFGSEPEPELSFRDRARQVLK